MRTIRKIVFILLLVSFISGQTVFAAAGDLDTSFAPNLNNYVRDIVVQPDGKIILGGMFTTVNGASYPRIVRLNSDGTVDSSFNPGTGFNSYIRHLELLSDGKIIALGNFTTYNGTTTQRIVKLNSDGSIDTSFNYYPAFNVSAQLTLGIQSTGKIIVGGASTGHSGTTIGYISRLNSDGTLDTSFNSGGVGFNAATTRNIKILSDDKILVVGDFSTYNGVSSKGVIRLNSDGSIDSSFNPGTGLVSGSGYDIEVQADGKYLLAGPITNYNGTVVGRIIRLNSDGSIDTSFNSGTGFNGTTEDILIQPDGKIYVGGSFTDYNGTAVNNIARLNSDGSIDTSFNTGNGFDNIVLNPSMIFDANYNLLAGGTFWTYNYISALNVARIFTGYTPASAPSTPNVPVLSSSSDSGSSNTDKLTNIHTPTITGTASSSAIVSLYESNSFVASTTSSGSGEYTFTISPALTTNRAYSYAVTQTVSSQTSATSTALEITFDNTADPAINKAEVVSTSTASITWETSSLATSTLQYGISSVTENNAQVSTATTSHSVLLTNLSPGTSYIYNITTTDVAGNSTTTTSYTFSTNSLPTESQVSQTPVFRGPQGGGQVTSFLTTPLKNNPTQLCESYISEDVGKNTIHSKDTVKKIQTFLNSYEKESLSISGVYDLQTENAVRRFQQKYNAHILAPWGLSKSTGIVSRTTRAKINSMMCAATYGCPYFTEYHKPGSQSTDVQKVKSFLNLINPHIPLDTQSTLYDNAMKNSVAQFQNRYKKTVLEPWGLKSPTSNWYKTTRKAAHEIMGCVEK